MKSFWPLAQTQQYTWRQITIAFRLTGANISGGKKEILRVQ